MHCVVKDAVSIAKINQQNNTKQTIFGSLGDVCRNQR